MTGRWLEEAVAACRLPPPSTFPRNLADEVHLSLSVVLERVTHLTSDDVRSVLAQRWRYQAVADVDRPLHGCLAARAGSGILFVDAEDDEDEQRFTLAHEVAHFVLEHVMPRSRARRVFGDGIRPVLDCLRAPTPEESLAFVLEGIPLGIQIRLMDRDSSGAIQMGHVEEAEQRADRLALELLAPAPLALKVLKGVPRGLAGTRVASRFGLPVEVARTYVRMLLGGVKPPRFSIQDLLGEVR